MLEEPFSVSQDLGKIYLDIENCCLKILLCVHSYEKIDPQERDPLHLNSVDIFVFKSQRLIHKLSGMRI